MDTERTIVLVTQDGSKVTLKEILEQFQGVKHSDLADKIELFHLYHLGACRGNRRDNNVVITLGLSVCETIHLGENSNSLIAYSAQARVRVTTATSSWSGGGGGGGSEGLWVPLLASNLTSQDALLLDVLVDVNAQVHCYSKEYTVVKNVTLTDNGKATSVLFCCWIISS